MGVLISDEQPDITNAVEVIDSLAELPGFLATDRD